MVNNKTISTLHSYINNKQSPKTPAESYPQGNVHKYINILTNIFGKKLTLNHKLFYQKIYDMPFVNACLVSLYMYVYIRLNYRKKIV